MRWVRHPFIHALPSILFLALILGFKHLQQEPYLSALLPAALITAILGIILYADAKARLRYSHYHHNLEEDTEQIYFNPRLSPIQKLMVMDQRTGCGTVLVALGYFVMSALFIGLWILGKYFPNKMP
jgi:hypothetical protein